MLQFYKPNRNNTGFACSFNDSFNNDCVFASIVKQSGWDDNSRTGSFKANLENKDGISTIKLNDTEIAAILDVIEKGRPFSTYHDGDVAKQIKFEPYFSKTANDKGIYEQKGFSFSISTPSTQDSSVKNAFYIGLTFPEARLLREYLVNTLNSHFNINRQKSRIDKSPNKSYNKPTTETVI